MTIQKFMFAKKRGGTYIMEFICTSSKPLNSDSIVHLSHNEIEVKHIAKLNNIYVVEAKDRALIQSLNVFDSIQKSREFAIADVPDVEFHPQIPNEELHRKLHAIGWQMTVGVLDTGVRKEHCKKLNESESRDFTGNANAIIQNHGTYVAKIISHFAPGAQIISLKVGHFGKDMLEGTIIQALDYAMEKQIDLLNLSFELNRSECRGDCKLCDYVNAVVETGMVVVAAAGNSGDNGYNSVGCPGRAEKAITVGSVNPERKVDPTSGRGDTGLQKPNIVAPGHIKVVMRDGVISTNGTSFAAPVVAGVLTGLIPHFGKDFAISSIFETCSDLGADKLSQGFGMLDLEKLVEVCRNEAAAISSSGTGQE